jgi:stage III sporulation protein SpoIIIAA
METLTEDITTHTMEAETANTAPENQAGSNEVGNDLLTGVSSMETDVLDAPNIAAPSHENMTSESQTAVVNHHHILKVEQVSSPDIPSGQNIHQAMEQLTKAIAEKTETWLLNQIDSNPSKRVLLSTVPGIFRDHFGADIDLDETFQLLGYTALRGFLESFPSMTVQALPTPLPAAPKIVYVCRAEEIPNDDAYEGEDDVDDVKLCYKDLVESRILELIDKSESKRIWWDDLLHLYRGTYNDDIAPVVLRKYLKVGGCISFGSKGGRDYVCRCEDPDPNMVLRWKGSKKSRTQVFQALIHALEANPSGLSSTELFHQVPELSKHNFTIASLSLFLQNCTVLRHETSPEGRTLYFKEENSKKRKAQIGDFPVNFKKSKVASEAPTDNDAALACLRVLQGCDGHWPATIEEMETFVFDNTPNNRLERQSQHPVLVVWADYNLERSLPRSLIKRLHQELINKMKCLNVQGSSYTWNRARVISILAQNSLDSNCPRRHDATGKSPETSCLRGATEVEDAPTVASAGGEEYEQGPVSRVASASMSPEVCDFVIDRQGRSDVVATSQAIASTCTNHSTTAPPEQMSSTNEAEGDNIRAAGDTNGNNKSTGPPALDDTIDLTLDSDTEESAASRASHPVAQPTSGVEVWNNTARRSRRERKAPKPSKVNAAAVACLRILSSSARRWPSSVTDWKIFLLGTKSNVSFQPPSQIASEPALITWLQDRMVKSKGKSVCASLRKELVDMGCIASNKGSQIEWNQKYVRRVLALNGEVANSGVETTRSEVEESGPGQMMVQSTSGIESKNAGGGAWPFQNTRSRTKPREVTDRDAVDACLRVLSGLKRPWPSNGSEWKVFILGSAASNEFRPSSEVRKEPDLVEWLREKMKVKKKPGKKTCMSLRVKLMEHGCISRVKGDKMIWQQAKVQLTLKWNKPREGPNCVVDTTRADQGLVAAKADAHITKAGEGLVAPTKHAIATQNSGTTGTVDAGRICFDVANEFKLASYERMQEQRPGDIMQSAQLEVSNDTDTLIKLLPEDLATALLERAQDISDIVLDIGRRPFAWVAGKRFILGDENRLIEANEINTIVKKLGGFGTDNRAGIDQQLHRISAIRNRSSDIIGLTMRVGRHVSGNTTIISDLLFAYPAKSILFLGEPGSGKTTVVREVSRLLSEDSNVCIVDTSNEIAGDGDTPHPCVGFARRLMVSSLDKQSSVMIECVQNHTPEVMIIDEIGRSSEVDGAQTCKNRGVRLVASAHGDLRKLIKNPKLRGLVGGVQTVLLGDAMAAQQAKNSGGDFQKVKAERAGPPTFDMIVELSRGLHHEWKVVMNTAEAVDSILQGKQYAFQKRVRDPVTGAIHMEIGKS